MYEQNNNPFTHLPMGKTMIDSKLLKIVVAALIVVIVVVSAIFIYSGMQRPLTVVESNSMQHSNDTSYLGIIDTGDMVLMVSPDKASVTTYVEGHQNGYSKFGSYGDVIIYYREGKNPVIHRAILWIDYDEGTGKWSAPSLKDYPTELWSNAGTWDDLTGILTLKNLPYLDGSLDEVQLNIDSLAHQSGYVTKGDKNAYFDQNTSIHANLVGKNELKAVAGIEIPWLGCVKLLVNHKNVSMIPGNSIPCLVIMVIDIIILIFLISVTAEYISNVRRKEDEC